MEQKHNVEFQAMPGTVSPFVLDNFTRYALPEIAAHAKLFVVEHEKVQVGFGVVEGEEGDSDQYVVVLQDATSQLKNKGDSRDAPTTKKVFHFLNNNVVQSYMVSDERSVMSSVQDQRSKQSVMVPYAIENVMHQDDLEKIITAWSSVEAFEGKSQAILLRLCGVDYPPFPSGEAIDAIEAYPLQHAYGSLESAIQILAADERTQNGMRCREKITDLSESSTRQESCALSINIGGKGRPQVILDLESSIMQSCGPYELQPEELLAASSYFYSQYPDFNCVEACYAELQKAAQDGRLCRQQKVAYSFGYTAGIKLDRTYTESFVLVGNPVKPDSVAIDFVITTTEMQDYFMSKQDAARPFQNATGLGGYFLPYTQNTLPQHYLEELTGTLGRLELLLRPTRWG